MPLLAQQIIVEEFFTPGKILFFLVLIAAIIIYVYVKRDRFFSAGVTVLSENKTQPTPAKADNEVPAAPDKAEEARIAAAIGAALNLYAEEIQEYEKTVLTIQKIIKPYSPWSSKIYGLRQTPTVTRRGNRS